MRRIYVNASGSLLPTLCAVDSGAFFNQSQSPGAASRPTLGAMAKHDLWPTLTVFGNNNQPYPGKQSADGLATALRRLPTLTCQDAEHAGGRGSISSSRRSMSLHQAVQPERLPTLAARDYRHPNAKTHEERGRGTKGEQLPNSIGGPLNPDWCEWFMGLPIGWSASSVLATPRFHEWLQQHGPRLKRSSIEEQQ